MSSAVADLETNLQAMLALKPPGVSGTKIATVTNLCLANIQSESVLIQKIYTHFKKAPGTHKLGVLYVVDSVTRKWMEQVKQNGQVVSSSAPDGTYGAGVHRVTELMPHLMNDIVQSAPKDQKDKIKKLVDIWEKGQTFPMKMLDTFKEKLSKESFTPPGSPPAHLLGSLNSRPNPVPTATPTPAVPANIMEALANIARQSATTAQSIPSVPAPVAPAPASAPYNASMPPSNPGILPSSFMNYQQPQQPAMPFMQASQPPVPAQAVNVPAVPALPFMPPQVQPQVQPQAAQMPQNGGFMPAGGADAATLQLTLLQTLISQGTPIDQIQQIMSSLTLPGSNAGPQVPPPQIPHPTQSSYSVPPTNGGWNPSRPDDSRDRNGYDSTTRSPNRTRGRSRSRSPPAGGRRWENHDSPRGRDERRFGDGGRGGGFGRNSPPSDRFSGQDRDRGGRARGGSDYRQRSPVGRRGEMPAFQAEKWIDFDPTVPNGHIKVLSRTLFVGGVTYPDLELREVFNQFGEVQTCIVNKEKRHAFVKMYSRKDAVNAKTAMEDGRSPDPNLRTRWGVGFGPRDCSDYQTGISIIPISKLTEADRKWMLTAPYGGSGGKAVSTGMVVEEPDIEIGAGVSSKAISRRMQTDKGGNHGPKSSQRGSDDGHEPQQQQQQQRGGGRHGRRGGRGDRGRDSGPEDRNNNRNGQQNDDNQPAAAGFPFGIPAGSNFAQFYPPGFAYPPAENTSGGY